MPTINAPTTVSPAPALRPVARDVAGMCLLARLLRWSTRNAR